VCVDRAVDLGTVDICLSVAIFVVPTMKDAHQRADAYSKGEKSTRWLVGSMRDESMECQIICNCKELHKTK
jgi:hypothetical protein